MSLKWTLSILIPFLLLVGQAPGSAAASSLTQVSCAELLATSLRHQAVVQGRYQQYSDAAGFSFNYMTVGDGEQDSGHHWVVLFPGTSGTLLDWPKGMLVDLGSSEPVAGCETAPGTTGSLCRGYRLLLVDYPGIGGTKAMSTSELDAEAFSSALDQLLSDLGAQQVSAVGWSLGTLMTLKYAHFTSRSLESLTLIATKPGGSTNVTYNEKLVCSPTYGEIGNQAPCVCQLFSAQCTANSPPLAPNAISETVFELMFPYENQRPTDPRHLCQAQIDLKSVTIYGVVPECGAGGGDIARKCANELIEFGLNRAAQVDGVANPWQGGVPCTVYDQERRFVGTWNFCYYGGNGASACAANYSPGLATNGGIAQCTSVTYDKSANVTQVGCSNPAQLKAQRLRVVYGDDDLFIAHAYGEAVASLYAGSLSTSTASCTDAGHGILLEEPDWTQKQILAALQGDRALADPGIGHGQGIDVERNPDPEYRKLTTQDDAHP